ncbi:unnamed protein product, partial [Rotaria socialis]
LHGKSDGMGERRPSIPLSLFIPRAAKDDSTKVTETSNDDQKHLDESHSDINEAFGPLRSVSSSFGEHPLISSLLDIKNDLGNEVRALTKRMIHIDEQISQIFNFLSPCHLSITNNSQQTSNITQPLLIPSQSSLLSPPPLLSSSSSSLLLNTTTTPTEINVTTHNFPQILEAPSVHLDANANIPIFNSNRSLSPTNDIQDVPTQAETHDSPLSTSTTSEINEYYSIPFPIPPPPSIYNRSASSSVVSVGTSTAPRSSISNKVVPTSLLPASASSKNPLNTSFRPISNTRFNPGRSPKSKARSHQNRSYTKHQQQTEKSTIIELEPSTQNDTTNKNVPLFSTFSSTTKSGSRAFRRFITGSSNAEKAATSSSSTLLYPPTSDDEHPISPTSSGNDDDDHRPLTSSSNKYHHQTLL